VEKGLDYKNVNIISTVLIDEFAKTSEVAQTSGTHAIQGYATNEWDSTILLPLGPYLANLICKKIGEMRRIGELPYLLADGKVQVSIEYDRERLIPQRVVQIVLELQTTKTCEHSVLLELLEAKVLKEVVPEKFWDTERKPKVILN